MNKIKAVLTGSPIGPTGPTSPCSPRSPCGVKEKRHIRRDENHRGDKHGAHTVRTAFPADPIVPGRPGCPASPWAESGFVIITVLSVKTTGGQQNIKKNTIFDKEKNLGAAGAFWSGGSRQTLKKYEIVKSKKREIYVLGMEFPKLHL